MKKIIKRCNIRRDFKTSLLVDHKLNFSKEPNYEKNNSNAKLTKQWNFSYDY
jgi:hypothetical protein